MPPQNQSAPQTPPVSPVNPNFSPDSLTKNEKFMTTIKTFAMYIPLLTIVNFVLNALMFGFRYGSYFGLFNVMGLIMAVIIGVVAGAVGGAIFYFLYDPLHNWVKSVALLSKYIHDMFTLFWIPSLVGSIISGAFGLLGLLSVGVVVVGLAGTYGAASIGGAFIGVVISFAAHLAVYYFYAKAVSAKLTSYYPW